MVKRGAEIVPHPSVAPEAATLPNGQPQCAAIKNDGNRCRSFARPSTGFCYMHDLSIPREQKHVGVWAKGGGSARLAMLKRMTPVQLVGVFDELSGALLGLRDNTISASRATAMASVATAMVRVLEAGELEMEIRELRSLVPDDASDRIIEEAIE